MLLVIAGGLLILGAALFALFFQRNSAPESAVPTAAETGSGQVPRVSLEEAKAAYDSGRAVFVDVRTAESYAQSHIPGSLSIPLAELPDRIDELDAGAWIILY
jgi:3-mercaptopyruvate sulfurtransferase SseA